MLEMRLLHSRRSRSGTTSFIRRFSYNDIKRATDNFRRAVDNSFHGYKANFQDGTVAMVKEVRDFDEGNDIFYEELQLFGCLHHRNIVSLTGYSTGHKRFLVFENMENGSLKEHLNDPLKTPLSWRIRLQIVVGVAAALEYLHFFCNPPVLNVSISSSTIMLDENFNAKICDIGPLSSQGSNIILPQSSRSKEIRSRAGGNIIFQLGLLILEVVTGQSSEGGVDLIQWVQGSRLCTSIHKMIDPDLGNSYDSKELKCLLAVARLCVKSTDNPTPFAPQIFRYLQKKVHIA